MWGLDCEESWVPKNWCFWTVVLEKTLESPLDCKEIQPVHSKGDQSWVFFGRNDTIAETPILWPPRVKSWLIGKDSDAGRDWGQEEKGMTEDEMVGWHHWHDGRESGWTPGVADGQGGMACCDSWGRKESETTERLNGTEEFSAVISFNKLSAPFLSLSPLPSGTQILHILVHLVMSHTSLKLSFWSPLIEFYSPIFTSTCPFFSSIHSAIELLWWRFQVKCYTLNFVFSSLALLNIFCYFVLLTLVGILMTITLNSLWGVCFLDIR